METEVLDVERGEALPIKHPEHQPSPSEGSIPCAGGPPRGWPILKDTAFHGLAGEFVRMTSPHTEADDAALLIEYLTTFGSAAGRAPCFMVGPTRHGLNLFVAKVGASSRSRKGTSSGPVRRAFEEADDVWARDRVVTGGGLSSGEGLIHHVRDAVQKRQAIRQKGRVVDYETVVIDPGVQDKRCLIHEGEFARTLRAMKRPGATLSAVLRQAWDGQDLTTMTRSPLAATAPHVSIVADITEQELGKEFMSVEAANGFGNRVLWVCVRRSKLLPHPTQPTPEHRQDHSARLREALDFARNQGGLTRDEAATVSWGAAYADLTTDGVGAYGAITARAEAQVPRLSAIYALLDKSAEIRADHQAAAFALWDYCADSARYLFGGSFGDPDMDRVMAALRARPDGMSRADVHAVLAGHRTSERLGRIREALVADGSITWTMAETGGRPREVWRIA